MAACHKYLESSNCSLYSFQLACLIESSCSRPYCSLKVLLHFLETNTSLLFGFLLVLRVPLCVLLSSHYHFLCVFWRLSVIFELLVSLVDGLADFALEYLRSFGFLGIGLTLLSCLLGRLLILGTGTILVTALLLFLSRLLSLALTLLLIATL